MYLLDTCTVSDFAKGHLATERHIEAAEGQLSVSTICMQELYYGLAIMQHPDAKLKAGIQRFLSRVDIVPFDAHAADEAAELRALLRRKGIGIGAYDVLIAATALARGLTLVTSNEREFRRVPGLEVENWRG